MLRRLLAAAVPALVLAVSACSDDPVAPRASEAGAQHARGSFSRVLTPEQDARAKQLQVTRATSAGTIGHSSLRGMLEDVSSSICAWEVLPGDFTLAIDGNGFPRQGYLGLYVYFCDGTQGYVDPHFAAWRTSNANVISVNASALVTAVGAGQAIVCAYMNQEERCARGTVLAPARVSRIAVNPASFTVRSGGTVQLGATVYDQYGYQLYNVPLTWSTSNGGIASVSASGLVTGVSFGTATIRACNGSVCGSATASVDPLSVRVNGPCPTCVIRVDNVTRTFTAMPSGGNGVYTYSWTLSRPDGYTVTGFSTDPSVEVLFNCWYQGENYVEVTVTSGGQTAVAGSWQYVEIPQESCLTYLRAH